MVDETYMVIFCSLNQSSNTFIMASGLVSSVVVTMSNARWNSPGRTFVVFEPATLMSVPGQAVGISVLSNALLMVRVFDGGTTCKPSTTQRTNEWPPS